MFVTTIIKSVLLKHERQVAHLDYKDAVAVQTLSHIAHKSVRVFQVVKHGNRRNRLGLLCADRLLPGGKVKEVIQDLRSAYAVPLLQISGRLKTDEIEARYAVTAEQGAVVRAYVYNIVSLLRRDQALNVRGNVAQGVGHGFVHAGAVPVVAVHGLVVH